METRALLDIPRDKDYPDGAVQCHTCGGLGCRTCGEKGWLPAGHPSGRRCEGPGCRNLLAPSQISLYCCEQCEYDDVAKRR